MYWQDMREEQFPIAMGDVGSLCVLPLCGMEKKGRHLPVGTDGFIVDAILEETLKTEKAVIFPTGNWLGEISACPMTNAEGETTQLGAISLSTRLQITLLEELCDEIARNGFNKVMIVHKLPSNSLFLGFFKRHMSSLKKPYATLMVSAVNQELSKPENVLAQVKSRRAEFPSITDEDIATLEKWAERGYGGKDVTFSDAAMVMACDETLVAKDRFDAEDYQSTHAADALESVYVSYANMRNRNFPNGSVGYAPEGCTKSIGEAYIKINAEHMAKVFRTIKQDAQCVLWDARYN